MLGLCKIEIKKDYPDMQILFMCNRTCKLELGIRKWWICISFKTDRYDGVSRFVIHGQVFC